MPSFAIWKFVFTEQKQVFEMPEGAQVFHCHAQNADVCLWAGVDSTRPMESRTFHIIGTGWKFGDDLNRQYIGTAHIESAGLVWHVFEILPKE